MFGFIPEIIHAAVSTTIKAAVEIVELPEKCVDAIAGAIEDADKDKSK